MLLVKDTVYVEPLRMHMSSRYSMDGSHVGTRTRCRQWPSPIPLWSAGVRDKVEDGQYFGFLSLHGHCSILGESRGDIGTNWGGSIGIGHCTLCFNQAEGDFKSVEQKA